MEENNAFREAYFFHIRCYIDQITNGEKHLSLGGRQQGILGDYNKWEHVSYKGAEAQLQYHNLALISSYNKHAHDFIL